MCKYMFLGGRNKYSIEAAFLTAPLRWGLETTPVKGTKWLPRGVKNGDIKTMNVINIGILIRM